MKTSTTPFASSIHFSTNGTQIVNCVHSTPKIMPPAEIMEDIFLSDGLVLPGSVNGGEWWVVWQWDGREAWELVGGS